MSGRCWFSSDKTPTRGVRRRRVIRSQGSLSDRRTPVRKEALAAPAAVDFALDKGRCLALNGGEGGGHRKMGDSKGAIVIYSGPDRAGGAHR